MIRPLRRTHRVASVVLLVALPAGIAVSVGARVQWRTVDAVDASALHPIVGRLELPVDGTLFIDGAPTGATPRALDGLPDDLDLHASVWPTLNPPVLGLRPARDLQRPDLLVYWQPRAASDVPAPDATLLGTLAGTAPRAWRLPRAARDEAGTLVLYSLGHDEVVATVDLDPVRN